MGDHRFEGIPAILVGTCSEQRDTVDETFRSRYGHDYDIYVFETSEELLMRAGELRSDNHGIALVATEMALTDGDGVELLDRVHTIDATSRRIVLLSPGAYSANLPALRGMLAEGRLDTWLGIPSAPRDEEFHAAIVEMLSDWSWTTNAIEVDGVQVVCLFALRSLGDQVAGGINGIVAFFCVTGGLGWLLVRAGHGADGLVWAAGAGMVVAALLQGARLWWVSRPDSPIRVWRTSA